MNKKLYKYIAGPTIALLLISPVGTVNLAQAIDEDSASVTSGDAGASGDSVTSSAPDDVNTNESVSVIPDDSTVTSADDAVVDLVDDTGEEVVNVDDLVATADEESNTAKTSENNATLNWISVIAAAALLVVVLYFTFRKKTSNQPVTK